MATGFRNLTPFHLLAQFGWRQGAVQFQGRYGPKEDGLPKREAQPLDLPDLEPAAVMTFLRKLRSDCGGEVCIPLFAANERGKDRKAPDGPAKDFGGYRETTLPQLRRLKELFERTIWSDEGFFDLFGILIEIQTSAREEAVRVEASRLIERMMAEKDLVDEALVKDLRRHPERYPEAWLWDRLEKGLREEQPDVVESFVLLLIAKGDLGILTRLENHSDPFVKVLMLRYNLCSMIPEERSLLWEQSIGVLREALDSQERVRQFNAIQMIIVFAQHGIVEAMEMLPEEFVSRDRSKLSG